MDVPVGAAGEELTVKIRPTTVVPIKAGGTLEEGTTNPDAGTR